MAEVADGVQDAHTPSSLPFGRVEGVGRVGVVGVGPPPSESLSESAVAAAAFGAASESPAPSVSSASSSASASSSSPASAAASSDDAALVADLPFPPLLGDLLPPPRLFPFFPFLVAFFGLGASKLALQSAGSSPVRTRYSAMAGASRSNLRISVESSSQGRLPRLSLTARHLMGVSE
eukprot:CAMPEP_0182535432 /NCGR_PEP_ID=MMETSP1323-20130603/17816_1 /TAXON_ID=236787 /ORGANISM="Florenciella parvula, Strain RCC1693" /LENGTH=177 /DNA_ID=CAMNT_0024745559 /DNA_START=72 /DNA_END=603 /DNA_ORIENTATION=+